MTQSQHLLAGASTRGACSSSVAHHGLTAMTAGSLAEVVSLRSAWLDLHKRQGLPTTWAHPDRYCAELRVCPPDVHGHVVLFRDDQANRAMLIARIQRRRLRCHLGYIKPHTPALRILDIVHGGFLTDGTPAVRQAIVEHLQSLLRSGQVDMIIVNHLPVAHEMYEPLLGSGARRQEAEPHWRFQLVPGSYEQTINVFSSKHRREMRRVERVLSERFNGQVAMRRFDRPEHLEQMTKGCAAIAASTYQAGLGVAFTGAQPWREILASEASQGRLRAYWLECGGQPVAFQIGAVHDGIYFMDFMGHLPQYTALGVGTILHARVLQDLCNDNLQGVDYGFGHAEYKKTYGTTSCDEAVLIWYGSSWQAHLASGMLAGTTWVSDIAKQAVQRLGLHDRLRRAWRARLRPAGSAGDRRARPGVRGRLQRALRRHGMKGSLQIAVQRLYNCTLHRAAARRYAQDERAFDQAHCVDTAGAVQLEALKVDSPHAELCHAYQPTHPQVFHEILRSLRIPHEQFVFVDFGSGKGRVVLLASELPFRQVVGVEFSPQLHEVAQRNLASFPPDRRRCARVELLCMDALQYPIPDEPAVLYFFNPFDQPLMDRVLAGVEQSLSRCPRPIYLVLVSVAYPVSPAGFEPMAIQCSFPKVRVLRSKC